MVGSCKSKGKALWDLAPVPGSERLEFLVQGFTKSQDEKGEHKSKMVGLAGKFVTAVAWKSCEIPWSSPRVMLLGRDRE